MLQPLKCPQDHLRPNAKGTERPQGHYRKSTTEHLRVCALYARKSAVKAEMMNW